MSVSSRRQFWWWLVLLLLILVVSYWGGLWDLGRPPAPSKMTVSLPSPPSPTAAAVPVVTEAAPTPADSSIPSFDVVHLNPDGMLVMAGRAAPGASVIVKEGAKVVAEAVADARGEWVISTDAVLPPGTRELRLETRLPDGRTVAAAEPLALSVPERGRAAALAAVPPTAPAMPAQPPTTAVDPGTAASVASLGGAGTGGVTGAGGLALDALSYGEGGKLMLSGRASEGGTITAYLGDKAIGEAPVGSDGTWRLAPEASLPPGLHSLRLEQKDARDRTLGRVEIPFSQAASVLVAPGQTLWVVQPGNSLWRIARRTYGGGQEYERIYVANREQIRDPDLIYPGQVFTVPERR